MSSGPIHLAKEVVPRSKATAVAMCLFASLLVAGNVAAQDFASAERMGGTLAEQGYSITLDSAGNVYVTGNFVGTADFDPGPGVYNLTSAGELEYDVFVLKLDPNGNFVWAKSMGGAAGPDIAYEVTTDGEGNVYTTGWFFGIADFDPGPSIYNLTSAGSAEIFVSKLDPNGSFVWARAMGGSLSDYGNSIAVDSAGNVYTMGQFWATADFDPGPGIYNLTSLGDYDIFISKLDPNGNFVWAMATGGIERDLGYSIASDSAGNVYITGWFQGTADFDPGPGFYKLTSAGGHDILIWKLNPDGNLVWAKTMGGALNDHGYSITLDSAGNVYTTGDFQGTADFDPDPDATHNSASAGGSDSFISKLDPNGNFVWAKTMGGTGNDYGRSLTVNGAGTVYTTGNFRGMVDFDPDPDVTYYLTGAGNADIFVSALDSNGSFVWARAMGGSFSDYSYSIAVDSAGSVRTTGSFEYTADFDPGSGTYYLTSVGYSDVFVSKLGLLIGAGAVPDRRYVPGTPLSMGKAGGTLLTLAWGPSCGPADIDYEVYEGTLGSFTSHVPLLCSTEGVTSALISPSSGSRYYLVVPTAGVEGSYGRNSFGLQRPASSLACVSQAIGSCP